MKNILFLLSILSIAAAIQKTISTNFGRVCGFGDFNNDRNTDIIVHNGKNVTVLLQEDKLLNVLEDGVFKNSSTFEVGEDVVECSLGDFNGDSILDVLISSKVKENDYKHTLWVGKSRAGDDIYEPISMDNLFSQAMALDVDGDGYHDVLGFHRNGSLYCRRYSKATNDMSISCDDQFLSFPADFTPYQGMPNLYADVIGQDTLSQIVFMGKNETGFLTMIVYGRVRDEWSWKKTDKQIPNCDYKDVAAPVVGDFNADKMLEILLPVCKDEKCDVIKQIAIWHKERGWSYQQFDQSEFTVVPEQDSKVIFRVGDFNSDGFVDLLTTCVLKNSPSKATHPKIIENVECKNCDNNETRKFEIKKDIFIQPREVALGNITMSAFFDLKEDGNLDILVEYTLGSSRKFSFIMLDDRGDTTFLKVQVFTPVCRKQCGSSPSSNEFGSGISWGGSCMWFSMSNSWGGSTLTNLACQMPSVTHRTLHSPFVLFGLGRSPNFVDKLAVGAPKYTYGTVFPERLHLLKQIVPNSRIVMVPPSDGDSSWITRLYVTPSQLIVQSLCVMVSVCAILLIVVFILHYREKKEDRVERQQMSYRFHFDAM